MKFEDIKSITIEDVCDKAKEIAGDVLDFAEEHKEGIAVGLPCVFVAGGFVRELTKERKRRRVERERIKDQERKRYMIWDPRNMHHWDLRRPLTNVERRELDFRVNKGEHMADVLEDMRVLR